MDTSFPRFLVNGDSAVSAVFGDWILEEINRKVHTFRPLLTAWHIPGLIETAPTYYTLMIHYDPCLLSCEELLQKFRAFAGEISFTALPPNEAPEIPVLYSRKMEPDLAYVAEHAGIFEAEVIKLHNGPEYLIYMLDLIPGFTCLDGLNPKLEIPRLETPRVLILTGLVGIIGKQTGIYPTASSGGWQPIGRTPVRMYDPDREVPILSRAGQCIHFSPIAGKEYRKIEAEIEAGAYWPNTRKREEAKA